MPLVSADLFEGVMSLQPQAQRSYPPQGPSTPVTAVGMEGHPRPLLAPSGPCVAEPHLRLGMCGFETRSSVGQVSLLVLCFSQEPGMSQEAWWGRPVRHHPGQPAVFGPSSSHRHPKGADAGRKTKGAGRAREQTAPWERARSAAQDPTTLAPGEGE